MLLTSCEDFRILIVFETLKLCVANQAFWLLSSSPQHTQQLSLLMKSCSSHLRLSSICIQSRHVIDFYYRAGYSSHHKPIIDLHLVNSFQISCKHILNVYAYNTCSPMHVLTKLDVDSRTDAFNLICPTWW